jgi:hypothetical protein
VDVDMRNVPNRLFTLIGPCSCWLTVPPRWPKHATRDWVVLAQVSSLIGLCLAWALRVSGGRKGWAMGATGPP